MEKVLVVIVRLHGEDDFWPLEDVAAETKELVKACAAEVTSDIICKIEKVTPNFFIGKGKVEEIAAVASEEEVDTVVFSCDLSGTQQRNLEDLIGKKTIDRTQLILDIFARHAHTQEGKLQVELAQLGYLLPRLVGKGVMLSRLGGGIGTRGPGEKKLEIDRRRIRERIEKLKADLKQVVMHRAITRKKRKEMGVPTVALVGYTNAGKSTLLNSLTNAGQVVADSLFTTLDPLTKSLKLPNGEQVIVSDTVGFLHNLPHHLIEAFKATLEEVLDADLLIHVLDISHQRLYEHAQAVEKVLIELGVDKKPRISVLNKVDRLEDTTWLKQLERDFTNPVLISATLKQNLEQLLILVQEQFKDRMMEFEVLLEHGRMDLVDLFYRQGKVEEIEYLNKGVKIKGKLPKNLAHKLLENKGLTIIS